MTTSYGPPLHATRFLSSQAGDQIPATVFASQLAGRPVAHVGDQIAVTAKTLEGEVLFGPQLLPKDTAVRDLRAILWERRLREGGSGLLVVKLKVHGHEVLDDFVASRDVLECKVSYSRQELLRHEKDFCLRQIDLYNPQQSDTPFLNYSDVARADRDVAWQAVTRDLQAHPDGVGDALRYVREELRADREFMIRVVVWRPEAFVRSHDALKGDQDFIRAILHNNPLALQSTEIVARATQDLVLLAIQANPSALMHAGQFRSDPRVVLQAFEAKPEAARFLDPRLLADPRFVLDAVRRNELFLGVADLVLRTNFRLAASEDARCSLANATCIADQSLLIKAASDADVWGQHATWAVIASPELMRDRVYVMAAVKFNPAVFRFVHAELRGDRSIFGEAAQRNPAVVRYTDEGFRSDWELMAAVVDRDAQMMQYVSDRLRADRDFVLHTVAKSPGVLEFADASLKADREVVRAAIGANPHALAYADRSLQGDRELVVFAVKRDPKAIKFASPSVKTHPEVLAARAAAVALEKCALAEEALAQLRAAGGGPSSPSRGEPRSLMSPTQRRHGWDRPSFGSRMPPRSPRLSPRGMLGRSPTAPDHLRSPMQTPRPMATSYLCMGGSPARSNPSSMPTSPQQEHRSLLSNSPGSTCSPLGTPKVRSAAHSARASPRAMPRSLDAALDFSPPRSAGGGAPPPPVAAKSQSPVGGAGMARSASSPARAPARAPPAPKGRSQRPSPARPAGPAPISPASSAKTCSTSSQPTSPSAKRQAAPRGAKQGTKRV